LTLSGANDKVLNLKTELANFDRLNPQVAWVQNLLTDDVSCESESFVTCLVGEYILIILATWVWWTGRSRAGGRQQYTWRNRASGRWYGTRQYRAAGWEWSTWRNWAGGRR
jgi:hypothetical protein